MLGGGGGDGDGGGGGGGGQQKVWVLMPLSMPLWWLNEITYTRERPFLIGTGQPGQPHGPRGEVRKQEVQ